jgi:hypothetical protein
MVRIARLGYLAFEVSDPSAWRTFAVDRLGLALGAEHADGSMALRMDDQAQRILLLPGARDDSPARASRWRTMHRSGRSQPSSKRAGLP